MRLTIESDTQGTDAQSEADEAAVCLCVWHVCVCAADKVHYGRVDCAED